MATNTNMSPESLAKVRNTLVSLVNISQQSMSSFLALGDQRFGASPNGEWAAVERTGALRTQREAVQQDMVTLDNILVAFDAAVSEMGATEEVVAAGFTAAADAIAAVFTPAPQPRGGRVMEA